MKLKFLMLLLLITVGTQSECLSQTGTNDTICIKCSQAKKMVAELMLLDKMKEDVKLCDQEVNFLNNTLVYKDSLISQQNSIFKKEMELRLFYQKLDSTHVQEFKRTKKLNLVKTKLNYAFNVVSCLFGILFGYYAIK